MSRERLPTTPINTLEDFIKAIIIWSKDIAENCDSKKVYRGIVICLQSGKRSGLKRCAEKNCPKMK